jgi:hypothetical protein
MTLIELPDNHAAALKAKAALQGLTLKAWLGKLAEDSPAEAPRKPLKTGRGMLSKDGPAHPLRKSTRTARTCSTALAKTFDDRWRRGYPYRPLVSLQ